METSEPEPKSNDKSNSQENIPRLGFTPTKESQAAYLAFTNAKVDAEGAMNSPEGDYKTFQVRQRETAFFAASGAAPYIMGTQNYVNSFYNNGNWKDAINNSKIVKAVAIDRQMQNDLVATGKLKSEYIMKDDRLNRDISVEDIQDVSSKIPNSPTEVDFNIETPLVTVNDFTEKEQNEAKEKWIKDNPEEHAKDLAERVKKLQIEEGAFQAKKALHERGLDLNLDIPLESINKAENTHVDLETTEKNAQNAEKVLKESIDKSFAGELEERTKIYPKVDLSPEDVDFRMKDVPENNKALTEVELLALAEKYAPACAEAMPRVEERRSGIERRGKKAQENLEKMGLTNIEKGLAAWKKVHPGYKMALGLALGASGLGAVSVGLSALTFTEKGYSERREALEKEGKIESKYWTLTKSAGIGLLLALGTSHLSQLVGTAVSEHAPGIMDSVRGFFSGAPTPVVSPSVETVPFDTSSINGLDEMPRSPGAWYGEPSGQTASLVESNLSSSVISGNLSVDNGGPDLSDVVADQAEVLDASIGSQQPEMAQPTIVSENFIRPEVASVGFDERSNIIGNFIDATSPIALDVPYTMMPGDNTNTILFRVLNSVDELKVLPLEDKLQFINDMKEQWSTPMSSLSTPYDSLKEMAAGGQVHHLDHVRGAFVTLGERAHLINKFGN